MESKANKHTGTKLGLMATAVGEIMRDQGHVMFCPSCKRAEMPGAIRCGRCGVPVGRVRKPARDLAAKAAA